MEEKLTGAFRFRQSMIGTKLILQMEYTARVYNGHGVLSDVKEWRDASVSDLFRVEKLEDFGKFIHVR